MNIIETNLQFNGSLAKRNSTDRIILHNTGVTALQSVEVIHDYHKNTNGWAGIGYHFYVRKDGTVYRGRPENTIGAHALGANADSIGICFEGNFNIENMNDEQLNAGKELIVYLKEKYNIETIIGHNEVNNTDCPGSNFPMIEMRNFKINENNNINIEINNNEQNNDIENKSIDDLAEETIKGKYGNGNERKNALGSLYNKVQNLVNKILMGNKKTSNKKSNEEIANDIIYKTNYDGWGTGETRKKKLTEAGYDYNIIQNIINKKLK